MSNDYVAVIGAICIALCVKTKLDLSSFGVGVLSAGLTAVLMYLGK